ncbi:hypothetical protein GCM10010464_83280 [Pseudonocardia yunnanensis]
MQIRRPDTITLMHKERCMVGPRGQHRFRVRRAGRPPKFWPCSAAQETLPSGICSAVFRLIVPAANARWTIRPGTG